MRIAGTMLVLMCAAAPAAAQAHAHGHGEMHGDGQLPAGWHALFDNAEHTMADAMFMAHGDGFHARVGRPRAVFWNPANEAGDRYTLSATFTQEQAPERLEGYGLVFGGEDLGESEVEYFYVLIRHDGQFIVKQRSGAEYPTIQGWTPHPALNTAETGGKVVNTLTVDVGDRVRILANGQELASFERSRFDDGDLDGVAGLRINHGLDVFISAFTLEKK